MYEIDYKFNSRFLELHLAPARLLSEHVDELVEVLVRVLRTLLLNLILHGPFEFLLLPQGLPDEEVDKHVPDGGVLTGTYRFQNDGVFDGLGQVLDHTLHEVRRDRGESRE